MEPSHDLAVLWIQGKDTSLIVTLLDALEARKVRLLSNVSPNHRLPQRQLRKLGQIGETSSFPQKKRR